MPALLACRDLLGIAKQWQDRYVCLPLRHHLATDRSPLAPFATKRRLNRVTILDGVSRLKRVEQMPFGTDTVIGMPGRVCDLLTTGNLHLAWVRHFVLDEAGRMLHLDLIRRIAALPAARETALFSATMPKEGGARAEALLRDPVPVSIPRRSLARGEESRSLAVRRTLGQASTPEATARRSGDATRHRVHPDKAWCDRVAAGLEDAGESVGAIHGNKSQPQRELGKWLPGQSPLST